MKMASLLSGVLSPYSQKIPGSFDLFPEFFNWRLTPFKLSTELGCYTNSPSSFHQILQKDEAIDEVRARCGHACNPQHSGGGVRKIKSSRLPSLKVILSYVVNLLFPLFI